MNHTRLDQLSDGIFAIVMTILVFEMRIPDILGTATNEQLWAAVQGLLPSFLTYLLTFALLFTYWRAHHFFVSIYAKNVDLELMNINLVFFMLVSLIPFSASFLGRYSGNEIAVGIFGFHIILIGLTLFAMRSYVFYSPHIKNPEISHREIVGSTIRTLVPVAFAIIAIGLSFININYSLFIFTLAVLFNLSSTSTKLFTEIFNLK